MNIKRPRNTKQKGNIEYLIYKNKDKYIGVCLTFDIVEESKNLAKLKIDLQKASLSHLECVRKEKLSDDLLNRYAPEKYWIKYFEAIKSYQKQQLEKILSTSIITEQNRYSNNLTLA